MVVFLIGLLLAFVLYGLFPILFAFIRKSPITAAKYRTVVIIFDIAVWFVYHFLTETNGNLIVVMFWGGIGYKLGIELLSKKSLVVGYTKKANKVPDPVPMPRYNSAVVKSDEANHIDNNIATISVPTSEVHASENLDSVNSSTITDADINGTVAPSQTPSPNRAENNQSAGIFTEKAAQSIVGSSASIDAEHTESSVKINFCYNCGYKLVNGSNFCSKCGIKVIKIVE